MICCWPVIFGANYFTFKIPKPPIGQVLIGNATYVGRITEDGDVELGGGPRNSKEKFLLPLFLVMCFFVGICFGRAGYLGCTKSWKRMCAGALLNWIAECCRNEPYEFAGRDFDESPTFAALEANIAWAWFCCGKEFTGWSGEAARDVAKACAGMGRVQFIKDSGERFVLATSAAEEGEETPTYSYEAGKCCYGCFTC